MPESAHYGSTFSYSGDVPREGFVSCSEDALQGGEMT